MSEPWPQTPPTAAQIAAFEHSKLDPFWLADVPELRQTEASLGSSTDADLCIVGGGFTGLWAAIKAKVDQPARDVVLLESEHIGYGASGRNGGFLIASLTHGIGNGVSRWPDEMHTLEQLGLQNYDELKADLERFSIECDLEETGELTALLENYQLAWLDEEVQLLREYGHEVVALTQDEMRAEVNSPTYIGGIWDKTGAATVHPGKLALGLKRAALQLGVRIYEQTEVTDLWREDSQLQVMTPHAMVHANKVLLATNAFLPLAKSLKKTIAPVYDYVLVTEPLSSAQLDAIGWKSRQGIGDGGNQFHYYRLTPDNRILFGGYDAIYQFGGEVKPERDDRSESFATLSQHFFTTFPQLEGTKFTHRWGGAIDTCSRFSVFFGTEYNGDLAYAAGYTGLGVCASRFGGHTALDLLDGNETQATNLRFVTEKPTPFPPEPLRWLVIQITRNRLAKADRNDGKRGFWLRTLDRMGVGFDS